MKTDIAAKITATIIEKLEAGTKPWVQPWTGQPISRPLRHCASAYRGINTLILWMVAQERGYASPYWMTYRQAAILNGQVRKGEKATQAIYYKTFPADNSANDKSPTEKSGSKDEEASVRRLMRQYAVFNADQIDGLPERYYPVPKDISPLPESIHRPKLDAVFSKIPAIVRHNGFQAYYNQTRDEIVMPEMDHFTSYEGYFGVRMHETGHWSGAKNRLGRTFGKRFGDAAYAMEELVVEIFTAMMSATLGLPEAELDNHASYIDGWLKILKADKNAILTAASKADEIVNYILGFAQGGISTIVEKEPKLVAA